MVAKVANKKAETAGKISAKVSQDAYQFVSDVVFKIIVNCVNLISIFLDKFFKVLQLIIVIKLYIFKLFYQIIKPLLKYLHFMVLCFLTVVLTPILEKNKKMVLITEGKK
ncbi:hypothetical protein LFWB_3870 [Candidatus Phytoplasma luffae]|uniref:Uncharacterized protein n=1 Tax=Loofah witches'-broom phytoplasma TaxID=35773 RepID=A0A975FIC0_LOWBP|nr:hypothetical protein [Candidatus Phytoplasma luffae]QTX02946.1 hypothetical protein LFWB_3780 [Candidatus Phytoplasma luffae]QTX02955.1 hypothetical protein LFWB_3870 [Candidatus Phytoplasma luffae]